MGDPPSEDGAPNETVSWPLPGVTLIIIGASGVVLGVAAVLAVAVPVPTMLTARICTL